VLFVVYRTALITAVLGVSSALKCFQARRSCHISYDEGALSVSVDELL